MVIKGVKINWKRRRVSVVQWEEMMKSRFLSGLYHVSTVFEQLALACSHNNTNPVKPQMKLTHQFDQFKEETGC